MDSLEIAQKRQTEVGPLRQLVVSDPETFLTLAVPASAPRHNQSSEPCGWCETQLRGKGRLLQSTL